MFYKLFLIHRGLPKPRLSQDKIRPNNAQNAVCAYIWVRFQGYYQPTKLVRKNLIARQRQA